MTAIEFEAVKKPTNTAGEPLPLRLLRPFVDWDERRQVSVHVKLLSGFLLIAVLLLSLGIFSIGVLNSVDRRVETLTALHDQADLSRDMIYAVTAQSHFRAMALITEIDSWDEKIYVAKDGFTANLATLREISIPSRPEFFDQLEAVNSRFEAESLVVSDMYYAGDLEGALDVHIQVEHETSHDLENLLNGVIAESDQAALIEQNSFDADRRLLTFAVAAFSLASLVGALLLGAILSWSLIRPVRRIDEALQVIADGEFEQRVLVQNRDEFGSL